MITIKAGLKQIKPYLRLGIFALTLVFLGQTLRLHWQEVITLRLTALAWGSLTVSLGLTLLAHIWSGWVWGWILQSLGEPVSNAWTVVVYLQTNLAKYLPGNIWHFLGRMRAVQGIGAPGAIAVMSVVLEPLLMAAAALAIALVGMAQPSPLQGLVLLGVLVGIHPRLLNGILQPLSRAKLKQLNVALKAPRPAAAAAPRLVHYPLKPLLGELGFVLMRGAGFLVAMSALEPIAMSQWLSVIGAFSFAWLLGLVIPGAPGGLGVFEATALALLTPQFPHGTVLGTVALYRLISTIAEGLGAGLAWLDDRSNRGTLVWVSPRGEVPPLDGVTQGDREG